MKTFAIDSLVVTIANTAVHLSNYIVVAVIAAFFGATWQTDAFFLALSLPTFFVSAIVNAVGSVFIPIFAESRNARPQLLGQLIGSALLYTFIGTLLIVLIIVLIALNLFRWIPFENATLEFRQLVIEQTLWMSPVIVIQTMTGIISAFYNANGRFLIPPVTDAISTFAVLMIITIARSSLGIFSVPMGFVCGAILHLLFLSMFWHRFNVSIVWTWNIDPELRRSFSLSLPLILGTVVLQLGTIISRFLAAQLPEGSVTILDYANRISYGVMEFLTSGVLLVVLARWSQDSTSKSLIHLRQEVQKFVQMILFIVVPVVTIVISLRQPLVAFAFQRGNFSATDTIATASVLLFFMLGVPIDVVGRTYVRLFLVWKNTRIVGALAGLRVLVTVISILLLMHAMGVSGIALADTAGVIFITISFVVVANRKLGNTFANNGRHLVKIGISALGSALVTMLVSQSFTGSDFLKLIVAGLAGCITYIVVSLLLQSEQLTIVLGFLKKPSLENISL